MEKIEMLMQNADFVTRMQETRSIEDVQALLAGYDVEMTVEELTQGVEEARRIMTEKGMITEDSELSDDVLDAVSGGASGTLIFGGLLVGGLGALCAAPAAVVIGGVYLTVGCLTPGSKKR